jgi:hypothetical protein
MLTLTHQHTCNDASDSYPDILETECKNCAPPVDEESNTLRIPRICQVSYRLQSTKPSPTVKLG